MENHLKTVLLVDDEPFLLDVLSEYLEIDKDVYTVLTAKNGCHALEILSSHKISLVVSDIYMPKMTGLHLLGEIKNKYPEIPVILMTAYNAPQIKSEAEKSGCLHFIEKPFEMEVMRKLILDRIGKKKQGFVGTLKNIQLTDLIQMCCLSPISMAIRVTQDPMKGTIFIQDGEIVHAVCGETTGEEAFYSILGWKHGQFETLGSGIVPSRTIEKPWQSLLMEAARRMDEQANENQVTEPEETHYESNHKTSSKKAPVKVLIVDDSAMMCRALEKIIGSDESIMVIGNAKNGEEALEKINQLKPDLITLDVNMPVMDGSTALKHIMIRNPCPVIIISNMGSQSQANILDFLRLGAIDYIRKPAYTKDIKLQQKQLVEMIRIASKARIDNFKRVKNPKVISARKVPHSTNFPCERLVIINSGPGGYAETMRIIPMLPQRLDTSVIVFQNMAAELVSPLSSYLNKRSLLPILPLDADTSQKGPPMLVGGQCYIGHYNQRINLSQNDNTFFLEITNDNPAEPKEKGNLFDLFLKSVVKNFSGRIQVILLSGAEVASTKGLEKVKKHKGWIISQKPDTCMIPYPLQEVVASGLVDKEANPTEIATLIMQNMTP